MSTHLTIYDALLGASPCAGDKSKAEGAEASGQGPAAEAPPVLQPQRDGPIATGEEDEKTVLSNEGVLYNFDPAGWKERGRGELRIKVAPSGEPPPSL